MDVQIEHGLFIGPPTLHNMTQGQTMPGVAAALLGDPARWRDVARANNIDDPFGIPPGTLLIVPGGGKP